MDREGKGEKLEAWDWFYYADKVRKEKYNYDAEALRPYFQLENVREGIFAVAGKLYGITFTQLKDIPVYQQDVVAYEVKEADGRHIGVIYMDFFPRSSKRGGAWMTSYRKQSADKGARIAPVVSIVCNFTKPNGDQPALLTPDEVETFFHEFGHALHGLLSNVRYETLSGTSVPRDFVELPSQLFEHWMSEPEVLRRHAKHVETGEVIPDALIAKLQAARRFSQACDTVRYTASALVDMAAHTHPDPESVESWPQFEADTLRELGLPHGTGVMHRLVHFQHLFNHDGYAAGYYVYLWAQVLDADAWEAFVEAGDPFDAQVAQWLRQCIYSTGNSIEPGAAFRAFRGRDPVIEPLLRQKGLVTT